MSFGKVLLIHSPSTIAKRSDQYRLRFSEFFTLQIIKYKVLVVLRMLIGGSPSNYGLRNQEDWPVSINGQGQISFLPIHQIGVETSWHCHFLGCDVVQAALFQRVRSQLAPDYVGCKVRNFVVADALDHQL